MTGQWTQGPAYTNWRPRGTGDHLLILTTTGRGRFTSADGATHNAATGSLTLLEPGVAHDYATAAEPGTWGLLWAHFHPRPHWGPLMRWPAAWPGLRWLVPRQAAAVRRALSRMHAEAIAGGPHAADLALNGLEEALLRATDDAPAGGAAAEDDRVREIVAWIGANLADDLTVPQLAGRAGLGVSRFGEVFRRHTGLPPQRYVERRRLERAAELLEVSGLSVKEIARAVGFDNPFYLTLRFKKAYGDPPTAFRRARRGESEPERCQ